MLRPHPKPTKPRVSLSALNTPYCSSTIRLREILSFCCFLAPPVRSLARRLELTHPPLQWMERSNAKDVRALLLLLLPQYGATAS